MIDYHLKKLFNVNYRIKSRLIGYVENLSFIEKLDQLGFAMDHELSLDLIL